jgi:predicted aspartyl protease
MVNQQRGPVP